MSWGRAGETPALLSSPSPSLLLPLGLSETLPLGFWTYRMCLLAAGLVWGSHPMYNAHCDLGASSVLCPAALW